MTAGGICAEARWPRSLAELQHEQDAQDEAEQGERVHGERDAEDHLEHAQIQVQRVFQADGDALEEDVVKGARRQEQGVALADLCWAIQLTKEHLWEFLEREGIYGGAHEIFGELELLQLLERFFDHAIFYAALGYERAVAAGVPETAAAGKAV